MALVDGVNTGFVATAPTADPNGSLVDGGSIDQIRFQRTIAPTGAIKVIEIGFWQNGFITSTEDSFIGIYDNNADDDEPENLIGSTAFSRTAAGEEWKVISGLNIPITAGNIYWIAFLDPKAIGIDREIFGGTGIATLNSQASLPDPAGTMTFVGLTRAFSIYAVYETATGVTRKIKISGTFQDKPIKTKVAGVFVDKPIKVKVGGNFQDA